VATRRSSDLYPRLVVQSAPAFCAIGPFIDARGTVKFQSAPLVWYLHVIRKEKAMRVLVACASGVVGRQLVPALETAGHDVIGLARTTRGKLGRDGVAVDVLERYAVIRAVDDSAPDAIVNMLTAIPARINPKRIDRDFAMTNRLRTEGTENLLHAAKLFGVSQIVAQGLAYA